MERTYQANVWSPHPSESPRLAILATLGADVRTGERRMDALSSGSALSVYGLADCELSSSASTVSLVLRKNASAGGHGRTHPGTRSTSSENAVAGRAGRGS